MDSIIGGDDVIEFQVAGTKEHCGTLTADTHVAIYDVRASIDLALWLSRQPAPFVVIAVDLPDGGHLHTCVSLESLADWVNHATKIAAEKPRHHKTY
jgi:hypothetical protein